MSSLYVRDQVLDYLALALPSESVIDLTGEYGSIKDLLAKNSVTSQAPWLGVQFQGNEEIPVDIAASNISGKYRELGVVYFHVVAMTKIGFQSGILTRAEALMSAFRGKRLGNLTVDSLTPPNFGEGQTLDFEGGYTSASIIMSYLRDFDI